MPSRRRHGWQRTCRVCGVSFARFRELVDHLRLLQHFSGVNTTFDTMAWPGDSRETATSADAAESGPRALPLGHPALVVEALETVDESNEEETVCDNKHENLHESTLLVTQQQFIQDVEYVTCNPHTHPHPSDEPELIATRRDFSPYTTTPPLLAANELSDALE